MVLLQNQTLYGGLIENKIGGTVKILGGTIGGQYSGGIGNEGTLIIDNQAIINTSISNKKDSLLQINNGTINKNISNYGTLQIFNGNINSYINNYGTVEMTGGTIKSSYEGIIMLGDSANVTIGTKGGEVNTNSPYIEGKEYGIYNEATIGTSNLNFYDGIIKGKTDSIYGEVTKKEKGYDVIYDYDYENKIYIAYLGNKPLFQIGEDETNTVNSWEELQNKINEWKQEGEQAEQTIKCLRKFIINSQMESLQIPEGLHIKIDINGQIINSTTANLVVNNGGTLELTDTATTKGKLTSMGECIILNNLGDINLTKIQIMMKGLDWKQTIIGIKNQGEGLVTLTDGASIIQSGENDTIAIQNNDAGTITINNASISNNSSENYGGIGIENNSTGEINFIDGTIKKPSYDSTSMSSGGPEGICIKNNSAGTVNVQGGILGTNYGGNESAIKNLGGGTVNITGGTLIASTNGSIINENGTVIINEESGKNVNIKNTIYNEDKLELKNGKISTENKQAIYNYETGTTTISGGVIENKGPTRLIYNLGKLQIEGGTIQGGTQTKYTIEQGYTNDGNPETTIERGTITNTENATGIAIYVRKGILNIGIKNEEEYDIENPIIEASDSAIENTDTSNDYVVKINFYDGIIESKNKSEPINGKIYELREGFKTVTSMSNGMNMTYLQLIGEDEATIKVESKPNVYFLTLQSAINICNETDTIILTKDIILEKEVNVLYKNLTIVLNNCKIMFGDTEITNQNKNEAFDNYVDLTITQ